jgi:hypothetical protein
VEYEPTRTRSTGVEAPEGMSRPDAFWKKGRDVIEKLICWRASVACP